MTTPPPEMARRLDHYAETLHDQGVIATDAVQHAFAAVERHRCVEAFYHRGERYAVPQDTAPPDEVLDIVYSDAALLTIMPSGPGEPASSSSAPTIMGPMLEALNLKPGMRVLEIGAGTGYNAALITTITGAEVVTVEAGTDAAAGAAASIRRLGLQDRVRVVHRDGYLGAPPDEAPFDRIIVTVGIAGIPPAWCNQLTDDGFILAPTAHGGVHPTMEHRPDSSVRPRMWSDFMPAVGPLRPAAVVGREPGATLTGAPATISDVLSPLETDAYNSVWFHLGARDSRTTRAYLDGADPWAGMCAIVDTDDRAAWLRTNGSVLHTDPALGSQVARLAEEWDKAGQPPFTKWSAALRPSTTTPPLLAPTGWAK